MLLHAKKPVSYLEPSPEMRELQLLELLNVEPHTSQSGLAQQVGLTSARVNAYISSFLERNYITTAPMARGLAYHLTARGRHHLAYHQVSYRAELVRLATSGRERFREYFATVQNAGLRRVAFYGAGETSDVVLDALAGTTIVQVVALLDDDPRKQGSSRHGVEVLAPAALLSLDVDGVVITSIAFSAVIRSRLMECGFNAHLVYSLS